MGLIKCKACGEKISSNAKSCPKCGEPAPKKTSLLTWLVLILIIIGIFGSLIPENSSSSSTTTSSNNEKKLKAQQERKLKAKREREKEKDLKYFSQSKEIIFQDLNLKMSQKKYNEILKITSKFPSYRGEDANISQIHSEVLSILEKAKLEKQEKHKKEIVEKLKTIPLSEYSENLKFYKILLKYEPNNEKYKSKVNHYSKKINDKLQKEREEQEKLKKEKAARLIKFGEPPIQSAWDGSYSIVERYLKRIANDPDSIEIDSCTKVYHTNKG